MFFWTVSAHPPGPIRLWKQDTRKHSLQAAGIVANHIRRRLALRSLVFTFFGLFLHPLFRLLGYLFHPYLNYHLQSPAMLFSSPSSKLLSSNLSFRQPPYSFIFHVRIPPYEFFFLNGRTHSYLLCIYAPIEYVRPILEGTIRM